MSIVTIYEKSIGEDSKNSNFDKIARMGAIIGSLSITEKPYIAPPSNPKSGNSSLKTTARESRQRKTSTMLANVYNSMFKINAPLYA